MPPPETGTINGFLATSRRAATSVLLVCAAGWVLALGWPLYGNGQRYGPGGLFSLFVLCTATIGASAVAWLTRLVSHVYLDRITAEAAEHARHGAKPVELLRPAPSR